MSWLQCYLLRLYAHSRLTSLLDWHWSRTHPVCRSQDRQISDSSLDDSQLCWLRTKHRRAWMSWLEILKCDQRMQQSVMCSQLQTSFAGCQAKNSKLVCLLRSDFNCLSLRMQIYWVPCLGSQLNRNSNWHNPKQEQTYWRSQRASNQRMDGIWCPRKLPSLKSLQSQTTHRCSNSYRQTYPHTS